jgi:hypothetical protein
VTVVTPLVKEFTFPITLLDMCCMPVTIEAAKAEPGNPPPRPPEVDGMLAVDTLPPLWLQVGSYRPHHIGT